jgi:hypothetical protein
MENGIAQDQILGIVREVLGRPGIGPDDDVFDHGATSLSFVRILAQINQRCGVRVPAAALGGMATARAMAVLAGARVDTHAADRGGVR